MSKNRTTIKKAVRLFVLFTAFCSTSYAQSDILRENGVSDGENYFDASSWFCQTESEAETGSQRRFVVTDFGVGRDSTKVQTAALQAVIDKAAEHGGTVVIPEGTFLSGALFFRPGTHLRIEPGGRLKGSDDIADFPVVDTRIEGRSVRYFAALVNADRADGFTISGGGTVDGNGLRYWRAFWLRREVNPDCTNMDEMRPRLVYISDCKDVRIEGVTLQNSPFWTTHLYRSERVRIIGCRIFAPAEPVKAPSSDAVDIDACTDVHIRECYLSVNDDAIALKGGKGPDAPADAANGANRGVLIEDCTFGFCHSALTCGSEAIHCDNILMRRCTVDRADRVLWLKMRPDTPQLYENITVEDVRGNARTMLYVHPWTQFFDLGGHTEIPMSYASHVTLRRIDLDCGAAFDIERADDQYILSDFTFERLTLRTPDDSMPEGCIRNLRRTECSVIRTER